MTGVSAVHPAALRAQATGAWIRLRFASGFTTPSARIVERLIKQDAHNGCTVAVRLEGGDVHHLGDVAAVLRGERPAETTPTGGHMETKQETASGWFWPTNARKAHADPGTGRSICGKWVRRAIGLDEASIEERLDAPPSPTDCAACRRGLDAQAEGR